MGIKIGEVDERLEYQYARAYGQIINLFAEVWCGESQGPQFEQTVEWLEDGYGSLEIAQVPLNELVAEAFKDAPPEMIKLRVLAALKR